MRSRTWACSLAFLLVAVGRPALAIIVITDNPDTSTGAPPFIVTQIATTDPAYTTSPTFKNSGAQYEGAWQAGGGTAVAPNWFLTTDHLGGNVGDTFFFNQTGSSAGTPYTTTQSIDVGNGMTLWKVNGTFSTFAPIFANSETSNPATTAVTSSFGYGLAADGPAVIGSTGKTQGFQWGSNTGQLTWGPSSVIGYTTDSATQTTLFFGAFLPTAGTGNTSATFAARDSGGGTFVQVNGTWELAGVNFGVTGPYLGGATTTPPASAGGFNAALWDQSGFSSDGTPLTGPQDWFANNINQQVANIIASAVPEPSALPLFAAGAVLFTAARRRLRRRPA